MGNKMADMPTVSCVSVTISEETERRMPNDVLVGMLGEINNSFQASIKSNDSLLVPQPDSPEDILMALREIPDLARGDFLRAYGMLTRDDRQFKSLVALPLDMRKDWLLMEIGIKYSS